MTKIINKRHKYRYDFILKGILQILDGILSILLLGFYQSHLHTKYITSKYYKI